MNERHDPSDCRSILRDAKRGNPLAHLESRVNRLGQSVYVAQALAGIGKRKDVDLDRRYEWIDRIAEALEEEEREWRRAETIAIIAKDASKWPSEDARSHFEDMLVELASCLNEPKALQMAVEGLAGRVRPELRGLLLDLAIGEEDVKVLKPVLKGLVQCADVMDIGMVAEAIAEGETDFAVRGLFFLHCICRRARHRIEPSALSLSLSKCEEASMEAVRGICALLEHRQDVQEAAASLCANIEDERDARIAITIAGRADRAKLSELGHELLSRAAPVVAELDDERLTKAHDKASARMGGKPIRESQEVHTPKSVPMAAVNGHNIALVATYEGAIATPHLRALARAAGAAAGFGVDITLIDWPMADIATLGTRAAKETRMAGGEALLPLLDAGRLHTGSLEEALAGEFGTPIATTHQPQGGNANLSELSTDGPLCLLMGMGRKGLPGAATSGCEHHFELTGVGASLETAVALGAIAQRLALL